MDRSISTPIKNNIFGSTWKNNVKKLLEFKENCIGVKNIEICLPYVIYNFHPKFNPEFEYIDEELHKFLLDSELHINSIFYMVLFLREGYNKQTFGIELKTNAKVIPQRYTRKNWYYYEWSRGDLSIRRILGTYDVNKIEKMAEDLLQEYKRFYYMYCNIN